MGTPKGLLDAGGRTFVARIASSLAQGGCDLVVVVLATGPSPGQSRLAAEAMKAGAQIAWNDDPQDGPITSLRVALSALGITGRSEEGRAVVWHPVDHPCVEADTVSAVVSTWRRTGAGVVVPRLGSQTGHPVLLGESLLPEALDPTLQGGLRTITRRHRHRRTYCAVEDPGITQGINTPDDYLAAFGRPMVAPAR